MTIMQGGPVDHSSHLSIPVAMSIGEVEYIPVAAACMRSRHLRMLIYDLKYLGTPKYDGDNLDQEPVKTIIHNEAAIWIGTKFQLADILTKVGNKPNFGHLWSLILHECQN